MSVDSQLATFVITIVTGMVLGFLFDFYRALRISLRPHWVFTAVADFTYWLVATGIVFAGLLLGNWGEVRLYVFFGLVGGVICYYRLFSRWALSMLGGLFRLTARLVRAIRLAFLYTIVKPLKFGGRLVMRPVRYLGGKLTFRRPPPEEPPPL